MCCQVGRKSNSNLDKENEEDEELEDAGGGIGKAVEKAKITVNFSGSLLCISSFYLCILKDVIRIFSSPSHPVLDTQICTNTHPPHTHIHTHTHPPYTHILLTHTHTPYSHTLTHPPHTYTHILSLHIHTGVEEVVYAASPPAHATSGNISEDRIRSEQITSSSKMNYLKLFE